MTMTGEEWLLATVAALIGAAGLRLVQWMLTPRLTGGAVGWAQYQALHQRLARPQPPETPIMVRRDLLAALVHDTGR